MKIKKISVFAAVVIFHIAVIGVIYLSTRNDKDDDNSPKEISGLDADSENKGKTGSSKTNPDTPDIEDEPDNNEVKNEPEESTYTGKVITHVVKKGEFLGAIATKYKVSVKQIMTLNDMTDPNKIIPGQKLKIPVPK